MPKALAVATYDFTLWLERWDGRCWIHADVYLWNKRVLLAVKAAGEGLLRKHGALWATHFVDDKKHEKFLRLFGAWRVGAFTEYDGRAVEVWKREA